MERHLSALRLSDKGDRYSTIRPRWREVQLAATPDYEVTLPAHRTVGDWLDALAALRSSSRSTTR